MSIRRSLLALALVGLPAASVLAQTETTTCGVPVFVHYCNWHEKAGNRTSWQFATTLPEYSDGYCLVDPRSPSGFDCFTGYRSLDTKTIERHNAQMSANCMVPLISWWDKVGEQNQFSGDLFYDLYLSIPSTVKAGILYEVTGRLQETTIGTLPDGRPHKVFDFGDSVTSENAQRFISDVIYLNEKYIKKHPERFTTIDGRPVLFIWLSHAFHGRFDLAVAELRKTVPVYIIGSDFNVYGPPGADGTAAFLNTVRGLDAVSSYGIYDGAMATKYHGHLTAEWVQQYTFAVFAWNAWLREHAPTVKLILPTQFTFHVDKPGNALWEQTTPAEARYLADIARALIDQGRAGCTNVLPYALHVSFNEHYEGTSVEPSFRNRFLEKDGLKLGPDYGDSFLKIFPPVFGPPLAPAPTCPAP